MRIERISVSRSRKFNHANEDFSNIQISVTLDAALADGDKRHDVTATLNAQAQESLDREEDRVRRIWETERRASQRKIEQEDELVETMRKALKGLQALKGREIDKEWLWNEVDPDIPF